MSCSVMADARPISVRQGILRVLGVVVVCTTATCRSSSRTTLGAAVQHLVYAAQDDGTIHVYDIDDQHRLVRTIRVFACCADVRGATAAAPTHRFYVMYNRDNEGHVASIDLLSGRVVWDKVLHTPGVDRGNLTPDGTTLYLPTWESDPSSPSELAVDS